jgi:hypothetical protein
MVITCCAAAVAGCGTGTPGVVVTPLPTPPASTPREGPANPSPSAICGVLTTDDVAAIVNSAVNVIEEDVSAIACAYHVAASPNPFDIVLRLEHAFASMDEVHATFPGGTTGSAPADLYWVGDVATGWFVGGGTLYAVQVLGDIDPATANSVASSVANLALPRL